MMLSYAATLLNYDYTRAEDVVQDACVAVARSFHTVDLSRELGPFLRRIVKNKVIDSVRKEQRMPLMQSPEVIEGMEQVYAHFETKHAQENWHDRLASLNRCISRLPANSKTILDRFYSGGLSLGQIAKQLRLTLHAVEKRISRIRNQVRICLERS